ncbi:spore protein [Oceanobacillus damuensis]|nr:spore protein [Oceanobacillus damuensis]
MKQSKKDRQNKPDRKAKSLKTGDKKLNGPNRPSV